MAKEKEEDYGRLWIQFRADDQDAKDYIEKLLKEGFPVYAQAVGTPPPPPNPPK